MAEGNGNGHKPKRGRPKGKGNISREAKAEMAAVLPEYRSQTAVAEAFGVSPSVVCRAVADPEIAKIAQVKKEQIADKFGQLVDKLLTRYLDIADTATLEDKGSTLLGIAADKHRLYSEEPTQITESRGDDAMRVAAKRALDIIRERLQCDPESAFEYLQRQKPELAKYVQ